MKNVAIIGAGASGLLLSKLLAKDSSVQVYVFEKCKNVGTKLRASGGGKANIFNANITPACYNDARFVETLLQQVSPETLKAQFESLGLRMVTDEEGRVYPYSQFSQTMVDILWNPAAPNVHAELEYEVRRLRNENGQWHINDYPVLFDEVVVASGSPANMIPANRKGYNFFIEDLHLAQNPMTPSLVGFKIKNYPKSLSGCRVKVNASLVQRGQLVYAEAGEVTFKDDGLSGIVILNLSAYYNRLEDRADCAVELDFLYDGSDVDVARHVQTYGSLQGILHPKLNELYQRKPFDVRKFRLEIEDTYDLAFAQVCHGGVKVSEIDEHFALKKHLNVYMMGEVLDIDGVCGGYNLFFAFASSMIVATQIVENKK